MLLLLTGGGGYRTLMRENEKCLQENVNGRIYFQRRNQLRDHANKTGEGERENKVALQIHSFTMGKEINYKLDVLIIYTHYPIPTKGCIQCTKLPVLHILGEAIGR